MLLPSLYHLFRDGLLPEDFLLIGAGRSALDDTAFRALAEGAIRERVEDFAPDVWQALAQHLRYARVAPQDRASIASLAALLPAGGPNAVFYLSISPDHFAPVCENLRAAGLSGGGNRVVVEKPIGRDLASCDAINAAIAGAFDEDCVYRADHYLGKETVQNLLALRFGNRLFEPLWNRAEIDYVAIAVNETVGVEGRWAYYDEYGALRDMVQSHILQLLCLIAMEPPARLSPEAVRDEKVKVLRSLKPIVGGAVRECTRRGQYTAGAIAGAPVPGYAQEGRASGTETFVSLEARVETWRWAGVPFYLSTGKRQAARRTEIVVQFLPVPHSVFAGDAGLIPNRLTITLQPEERISLLLMNKTPGLTAEGMRTSPLSLNLSLTDAFAAQRRRIAYEQILLDALQGNATNFLRRDEIDAAWRWVDAIIDGWKEFAVAPEPYRAGEPGPMLAVARRAQ